MADIGTQHQLTAVIEEQEIRGVTGNFSSGPVEGYEWRLRVTNPQNRPPTAEWLPWVFGSRGVIEQMLQQWRSYLSAQVSKPPPGETLNVRRVERHEVQNCDLPARGGGAPVKVIDLVVTSSGRSGDTDKSPNYRLTLDHARKLHQDLGTAIAVAESQSAGPTH